MRLSALVIFQVFLLVSFHSAFAASVSSQHPQAHAYAYAIAPSATSHDSLIRSIDDQNIRHNVERQLFGSWSPPLGPARSSFSLFRLWTLGKSAVEVSEAATKFAIFSRLLSRPLDRLIGEGLSISDDKFPEI